MGYTTEFNGEFRIQKQLAPEHQAYLLAFAQTRRVTRNAEIAATLPDPLRIAVGLPIGIEGEYFVNGDGFNAFEQPEGEKSITNYNKAPHAQPGLWCQWVPAEEGTIIIWDEGEKFYNYVEWIQYLIEHFLGPWGYILNGIVEWNGEERDDIGRIVIENNVVTTQIGKVVFE